MKRSVVILAGTILAAASGLSWAQRPTVSSSPAESSSAPAASTSSSPNSAGSASNANQAQLTRQDVYFIQQASASGLSEVEEGKLAQAQSSNERVKQFAQTMIDDHTAANDQLKTIATQKGQGVASSSESATDGDDQSLALKSLKGAAFDRRYAANEVKDHEDAIKLFQDEQQNGKDADLKSFAAQTLPKLQQHLALAKQISAEVGGMASHHRKTMTNSGSSSP